MGEKVAMKILYKVLCIVFLFSLLVSVFGCEREWHLTVVDPDVNHFEFCISRFADCKGDGVTLAGLNIDEVSESGELKRTMWVIAPESGTELKKVTYGVAPQGYKETLKAVPLEIGKIYSVLGRYFFRLKQTEGHTIAEVYNLEEFNKKFK